MQFICLKIDSKTLENVFRGTKKQITYLDKMYLLEYKYELWKTNTSIDTIIYWIHGKQVHKALLPYFRFLRHVPHM